MMAFIDQEANEKAEEIDAKVNEHFCYLQRLIFITVMNALVDTKDAVLWVHNFSTHVSFSSLCQWTFLI